MSVGTDSGRRSSSTDEAPDPASFYQCNVCLDTAKDPVVSLCGHLFCWPCIHQWIETRPQKQECPVCKAGIGKDKMVPIYGHGQEQSDPRTRNIPPRPQGSRPEPDRRGGSFGNPLGGTQFSFGIGAFPFGLFGIGFNAAGGGFFPPFFGAPQNAAQGQTTEDEEFLSKVFLYIGLIFIVWIFLS